MHRLKDPSNIRSVTDVGPGDFVKVHGQWQRITSNSAEGATRPRNWTVRTEGGGSYGMYSIERYAKASDLTE